MAKKTQRKSKGRTGGRKKKDAGMESLPPESDATRRDALGQESETITGDIETVEERESASRGFDEKAGRDQPGYGAGAP